MRGKRESSMVFRLFRYKIIAYSKRIQDSLAHMCRFGIRICRHRPRLSPCPPFCPDRIQQKLWGPQVTQLFAATVCVSCSNKKQKASNHHLKHNQTMFFRAIPESTQSSYSCPYTLPCSLLRGGGKKKRARQITNISRKSRRHKPKRCSSLVSIPHNML